MYCPNCGSEYVVYGKRGFNWRNGILGAMIFGDDGIFAGFIGSRDIICECKNCGYEWKVEER